MAPRIALGAPGIYHLPAERVRALTGERMDVCAFVGVAPRGPARLPLFHTRWAPPPCRPDQPVVHSIAVPVESWDHYQRLYGSFEGPGLLPYAVASFFENGGRRAYVVRIVHEYRRPDDSVDVSANDASIARGPFAALKASGGREVWLRARNDGAWGNHLRAQLSFQSRPLALAPADFYPTELRCPPGADLLPGALLRITANDGTTVIRRIGNVRAEWHPERNVRERWATLESALNAPGVSAELVEGVLDVDDGDGRHEVHAHIGLSSSHPRWMAAVLVNESELLYPSDNVTLPSTDPRATWLDADLEVDPALPTYGTEEFGLYSATSPGVRSSEPAPATDRYRDIDPADFFDADWVPGDECPGRGIHALAELPDLALLVAPDLYSPRALVPLESIVDPGGFAGAEFAECVELPPQSQEPPAEDLDGLRLDPQTDLAEIITLQQKLVEFADQQQSFTVLLDVPPRLSQQRMLRWRAAFDSAYAAAYHPWLEVARTDDRRDALIRINPAGVAAGIIAQREIDFGVPYGPANVIAAGVVNVEDRVSEARHDALHPQHINVFLAERDGVRLTAARTLSSNPIWRQLSVRRLITLLKRVLDRQMQWAVFEPNNATLRSDLRHMIEAFLRQLFLANAFSGVREEDAFFVRCDDELNPQSVVDQGRLIAQVGVAPAEPLEFIVLQIARDGDGTIRVEG